MRARVLAPGRFSALLDIVGSKAHYFQTRIRRGGPDVRRQARGALTSNPSRGVRPAGISNPLGRRRTGKTAFLQAFRRRQRVSLFFRRPIFRAPRSRPSRRRAYSDSLGTFLQTQPLAPGNPPSGRSSIISRAGPRSSSSTNSPISARPTGRSHRSSKRSATRATNRRIVLVLCGSTISFMEREVLGAKSPLFGRRTSQMDLRPFDFDALAESSAPAGPRSRARLCRSR